MSDVIIHRDLDDSEINGVETLKIPDHRQDRLVDFEVLVNHLNDLLTNAKKFEKEVGISLGSTNLENILVRMKDLKEETKDYCVDDLVGSNTRRVLPKIPATEKYLREVDGLLEYAFVQYSAIHNNYKEEKERLYHSN